MGPPWHRQVQWREDHLLHEGEIMLLTLFAKGSTGNIPTAKLKEIRRALED
jgi:hypothetical protein